MFPVLTWYLKDRFPLLISAVFPSIVLILFELVAEELRVYVIWGFHSAADEEPGCLGCDTVLLV